MVGAVFDDFRAFQTAFKAFQDETNRLFVVKKSNSVDPVNNSVILLYLTTISFISIVNAEFIKNTKFPSPLTPHCHHHHHRSWT